MDRQRAKIEVTGERKEEPMIGSGSKVEMMMMILNYFVTSYRDFHSTYIQNFRLCRYYFSFLLKKFMVLEFDYNPFG